MKLKKLVTFIVTLCISVQSYAISIWDGVSYDYTWYSQGSGATYHIKTAADLAGLSNCFSHGYYLYGNFEGQTIYLDDDIDLNGFEWIPIGTLDSQNYYYEFAGTFDGQGHTIKGLNINQTNDNPYIKIAGLFGYAPSSSLSIKNLKVEGNITISNAFTGNSYCTLNIGGIVGYSGTENVIENCQSCVDINITQNLGEFHKVNCGGIVGNLSNSNNLNPLSKCYSKGNIVIALNNANKAYVGGVAGQISCSNSIINECDSEVNIVVDNGEQTIAGGIVGIVDVNCICNALFSGSIKINYPCYGLVGGIGGMNFGAVSYENCIVAGSLSKYFGTGWLSAISGTKGEGVSVLNCYYVSDIPNETSYGNPISEAELKSGNVIDGFDNSIWAFPSGSYPYMGFTKPTYILNLALEGGYIGIKLNEGFSQKFIISQDINSELYQVLWNGEDISSSVDADGNLTTPKIYKNSILSVVYRNIDAVDENKGIERSTFFQVYGTTLNITNLSGINSLQIFNKAGALIYQVMDIGTFATINDLPHDFYIIRVNNEGFKIRI